MKFKFDILKSNAILWLSFLINIVLVMLVFARMEEFHRAMYTNSDTLYMPAIFKDLFIDKTGIKIWHLNGAPNFFPDMLVYFMIRAFTTNFLTASLIFSTLEYLSILFLGVLVIRRVTGVKNPAYASIGVLGMQLFLYVFVLRNDFAYTYYIMATSFHAGAYVMTLVTLYLIIKYIQNTNSLNLFLFAVFSYLGILNDKLFIVMFTIPSGVLLLFLLSKNFRRTGVILLLTTVVTFILAISTYNLLNNVCKSIQMISLEGKTFNLEKVKESYIMLFTQHGWYFSPLDIRGIIDTLAIISLLISIILVIRSFTYQKIFMIKSTSQIIELFYLLFLIVHSVLVFNAPALNGFYPSPAVMRYNIYPLYFNVINFGFLLYKLNAIFQRDKLIAYITYGLALISCVLIVFQTSKLPVAQRVKELANYYPEGVQKIDSIAKSHDLQYGISQYWTAKRTTMFSKQDVRLYHVVPDLGNWYHMTNENWYYEHTRGKYNKPVFTFLLTSSLDEKVISETFKGQVLDTIPFTTPQGNDVMLITEPFVFDRGSRKIKFIN